MKPKGRNGKFFENLLANNQPKGQKLKILKPVFSTYQTITLGTCPRTFSELKAAIEKAGMDCCCETEIEEMMADPRFTVSKTELKVDLVLVSGRDLLFAGNWIDHIKDIFPRAIECGLELCPPEVGPALFLQHRSTEWRTIGMTPIKGKVFEMTYHEEDLNPSTDGWSRDEKPLFQEPKYGPRVPLLTIERLEGGGTTYDQHFVFIKPRKQE